MIRIGIVGCGRILAAHLEGYKLLREAGVDGFEITALCSPKESDAQSYLKRNEGPPQRKAVSHIPGDPLAVSDQYLSDFQPDTRVAVYTDYREMIGNGSIDGVNDFSPHGLHHQVAHLCFQEKKHLLSQKPLAVSMAAANQLCQQADRAGVTFGVFENLRFARGIRQTQWAFSENGPAGNLQMILMGNVGTWWAPDLIVAETPWRHALDQAGGITLDLGPHFFDMIRHIGNSEVSRISGMTRVVEPLRYLIREGKKVDPVSCDADDTFFANFETKKGVTGTLFGSWAGHGTSTMISEGPVFYGSNGRVSGDNIQLDHQDEPESLNDVYERNASAEIKSLHFPMALENDFALAQLNWLQAVESGSQPECSGREGLLDLACSFAVVESDLAGRSVSLDEVVNGSLREYQRPIDERFGLG